MYLLLYFRGFTHFVTICSCLYYSAEASMESEKEEKKDLDSLKVTELRAMLRQRGLPVSGKKSDLIMRLRLAEAWAAPGGSTEESKINQVKITDQLSPFQERNTTSVCQESMQDKENQSANSIGSSKIDGIPEKIQRKPLASRPLDEVSPNTQQKHMMAHTAASAAKSVKGSASARKRRRLEVNKTLLELENQLLIPLA
jgi:hypothetical protein